MTQERTPLAVLVSALTDQPAPAPPGPTTEGPENQDEWWRQKKRKRAVACGRCDACCREDCGLCLNCLDKPKFGGNGIRKQSCTARKCQQSLAPTPCSGSRAGPSSASRQELTQAAHTQEWDAFWSAVECCMALQAGPSIALQASPAAPAVPASEEKGKRARAARCGSCTGCVRGDCGECKNCLDKPKFGGRGIKKQACIQRSCNNPQPEEESDNEIAQSTSSTASTGFLSEDASPAMLPIAGEPGAIALLELDSVQRTQPRGERLKPQSGMTLQTRKMLKQVRAESGSPGYSTADEEVAEPAAPSEGCPVPLGIAQALVMACERR
mmetsp:Transcript_28812/g.65264  ORF Transcript_28812/g.65264 Transcript_28812/m.65264 type:complete len:326 (-) Transcript_28812:912-1889(-)